MTLNERQAQILRECQRFQAIRTYHGLLPEKLAALYDEDLISELIASSLLERGTILSRCGGQLHGLRLTATAEALLPDLKPAPLGDFSELPEEELSADDISILRDVFHYCNIKRFGGIGPRDELEDAYGKKAVRRLYELGIILYIKLKSGKGGKKSGRKGYILSELGRRVLVKADTAAPKPASPAKKAV